MLVCCNFVRVCRNGQWIVTLWSVGCAQVLRTARRGRRGFKRVTVPRVCDGVETEGALESDTGTAFAIVRPLRPFTEMYAPRGYARLVSVTNQPCRSENSSLSHLGNLLTRPHPLKTNPLPLPNSPSTYCTVPPSLNGPQPHPASLLPHTPQSPGPHQTQLPNPFLASA